jgi:hypothetical protein
MLKQSPAMQVTATGYKLKAELTDLSRQYNTPGLDPAAKAKIKQDMTDKTDKLQKLDQFIMSVKEPDATKIAESSRKLWTDSPELATQYKNYEEFADQFSQDLKQTRSVFHDDLANIKTKMATLDIDPDYKGTMQSAYQIITQLANKKLAGEITLGIQNRLKKGDLKGAYDYATGWQRSLQVKPGTGILPSSGAQPASPDTPETFEQQVANVRKINKANTSAAGVNVSLRNIARSAGILNDPQTQLAAIERDHKAGLMDDATYNKLKNDVLVRQAAEQ